MGYLQKVYQVFAGARTVADFQVSFLVENLEKAKHFFEMKKNNEIAKQINQMLQLVIQIQKGNNDAFESFSGARSVLLQNLKAIDENFGQEMSQWVESGKKIA